MIGWQRSVRRASGPTPGWSTRCTTGTGPIRRRSPRAGGTSSRTTAPSAAAPADPVEAAAAAGARRPAPARRAGDARLAAPNPLRGAAARLVANMEASLAVPTATSARVVPARLLEVNRKVLNGHLARIGGDKVSFTHLIGYALVRALDAVPAMRSIYVDGGGGEARAAGSGSAPPRPRGAGPGHRRGQVRRVAHPARAVHPRRRHPRLRLVPRRLRGHRPPGAHQPHRPRRLRRRHHDPHQPGHAGHRLVGAPAHARPERDRRRGGAGLAGRVRRRRPPGDGPARHLQGADPHVDLRPPGDPGRRVGALPPAHRGAPARRRRLLRRRLPVAGRAVRVGALAARLQPARPATSQREKQVHVQTGS